MRKARPISTLVFVAGLAVGSTATAQSGYVVNSDDVSLHDFDALHQITLATGQVAKVGEVRAGDSEAPFADIEGLAFSPGGTLYGIDDATKTLVRIDPSSGRALPLNGAEGNTGLPRNVNLDFGLTFDCNGDLYASSDSKRSLYRLNQTTGAASVVGSEGSLGAPITALAAKGTNVYGMGSEGSENLYRIDTTTGRATLIGPLGSNLHFSDGGLEFDASGTLWGVADMSGSSVNPEPSIVFRINETTGAAERVATTISGVESLAIVPPVCTPTGVDEPIPAVPVLDLSALALLALLIALIGAVGLRRP
jgi:DNA-binding beta-propeller fold protein YncE